MMAAAIQHAQTDDIFGSTLTMEIGFMILIAVVTEEVILYRCVHYFLLGQKPKTIARTIAYALLLALDLFVIGYEVSYILPYIL
jgi:hypothetical protein